MFAPVTAARVLSVLACAAGLLGPGLAAAATQSEASPVQAQLPPKLIVVSLSVNRREVGEAVMILSDRPLIEASALERAGLSLTGAPLVHVDGRAFVALASLMPHVVAAFDEADVALRLTATPAAIANASSIAALGTETAPARLDDTSVFLNYALRASTGWATGWTSEAGWRGKGVLVRSTFASYASSGARRLQSTATFDDRGRLARWEGGDTVASLRHGGSVQALGLTFSREFGINPLFHRQAPLSISGATAVPAVAEVYVNDQLVSRSVVPPGTFELRDLSPPTGSGTVRVVLKDDFGREQQLSTGYYRSPQVLKRGLQEYRYSVGSPRSSWDRGLGAYDGFVASAEHRAGVTDWLTLGGHAARRNGASFGGLTAAMTSPFGEFEGEVAAAGAHGTGGALGAVTYAFRTRSLMAGSTVEVASDGFNKVVALGSTPPGRITAVSSVDTTVGRGVSLGLRYVVLTPPYQMRVAHELGLQSSISLKSGGAISVWLMNPVRGSGVRQGYVSFTMPLGPRSSASASHSIQAGEHATAFNVQQSLPLGPGLGYQVQFQDRRQNLGAAALEARTTMARFEGRYDVNGSDQQGSVTLAGALVGVGGRLHLSSPVDDAYALVRVPGVRGVRTYSSHQYVGRTNRRGDLLVPSLVSYNPNRLAIDDRDVPLTFDVPLTEALVQPALRGGGTVLFPVRLIRNEPDAPRPNATDGPAMRILIRSPFSRAL
jgi:outer membrane usher protein